MVETQHPPVIGISGSSADSASVRAAVTMIRDSGAIPLFLGNHPKRNADIDIKKIDGLMVLGNNYDIDPAKYGAANDAHTQSEDATPEGKARAGYEEAIMMKALALKMPVLGVCGGMQRLNVIADGTLHQHIPDLIGHDEHAQQDFGIAPFVPVQPVLIKAGSTLSDIAGDVQYVYTPAHGCGPNKGPGMILENSMHHQAVDKVGTGLRACAYSDDKLPDGSLLVEGIEADPNGILKGQFVMGVQWHPEFGASPLGAKLAHSFTEASQKFARDNSRQHPLNEAIGENVLSAMPQAHFQELAQAANNDVAGRVGFAEAHKLRTKQSIINGIMNAQNQR